MAPLAALPGPGARWEGHPPGVERVWAQDHHANQVGLHQLILGDWGPGALSVNL